MEMILYVVAGIFWEVYLIVECLNKRKMYEFTVMDIIIANVCYNILANSYFI